MPAGPAPAAPLAAFARGPDRAGRRAPPHRHRARLGRRQYRRRDDLDPARHLSRSPGRARCPRWFGAVSARFATPANSILFMGLAGAALAVSGSFVWLAIVSTLARLFVYAASIAALPKARRPGRGLAGAWSPPGSPSASGRRRSRDGNPGRCWPARWPSDSLLYALARRQAGSSSAATVSSIQPPPSTRSPS